jgi:hypothetical protein
VGGIVQDLTGGIRELVVWGYIHAADVDALDRFVKAIAIIIGGLLDRSERGKGGPGDAVEQSMLGEKHDSSAETSF